MIVAPSVLAALVELLLATGLRAVELLLGEHRAAVAVFGLSLVDVALRGSEADVAALGMLLAAVGAP